jgi:hypothetical protein
METNKIIAEFMGVHYECPQVDGFTPPGNYHDSWDWLMPVVEKIESMGFDVNILSNGTQIIDYSNNIEIANNVADISFDRKIEHTYDSVIKFIESL